MGIAPTGQPTAMEKLNEALTDEQSGLVSYLAPQDRVGLVVFRNHASVVQSLDYATGEHKQALLRSIQGIKEFGDTNVHDGIKDSFSAIDDISVTDSDAGRQKMVFLLSDGKPNLPQYSTNLVITGKPLRRDGQTGPVKEVTSYALDTRYVDERMVNLILDDRQKHGKPPAPRVYTFGMETADGEEPVNVKILTGIALGFRGDYRRVQDVDAVSRVVRGEFVHISCTLATCVEVSFDVAEEARACVTLAPVRSEQSVRANGSTTSKAFSVKSISLGQCVSRAVIAKNSSDMPQVVGIKVRYRDMTIVPPQDRVIQQSAVVPPRSRPAARGVVVDTDAVRLLTADAVRRSWDLMLSKKKGKAKQEIQSTLETVRQIHSSHVDSECRCDDYISDLESCDGEHLEKDPFDPEGYGAMRDMWTAHTDQRATDRGRSDSPSQGGSGSATRKLPLYATDLHKMVLGVKETNLLMNRMPSEMQHRYFTDPNNAIHRRDTKADIRRSKRTSLQSVELDPNSSYFCHNTEEIMTLYNVAASILRTARGAVEHGTPVNNHQVYQLLKKHGRETTLRMIDVTIWAQNKKMARYIDT